MPQKVFPWHECSHAPQDTNSINGQNLDWVNYSRSLGSLLYFSGLQYCNKNWLKDCLQISLQISNIIYNKSDLSKIKVSLIGEETSEI